MPISKSTKKKLIKQLIAKYGENWKTPLAKDLGVDISTIRRIFNQREYVPILYIRAIENLLHEDQNRNTVTRPAKT